MKIYKGIIIVLFCLMLITACNSKATQTSDPKATIPDPAPGKGVVYGTALNSKTGEPIKGTLFLAKNITYEQEGIPPTISFSTQNDPSAIYNSETGEFYFQDIEPSPNYVFVLHNGPNDFFIIRENNSELPLTISIEEGLILDVGVLSIDEP